MSHRWRHHHFVCFIVTSFVTLALLPGCKEEVTRKADWETHFTDLHFANAKLGWIVGLEGLIIHTDDSGQTWNRQEVDTTGDFKAVHFANSRYGWAVGDDGLIAATDDGGRHWYLQRSGTWAMLRDVFFANAKEGWVVGEGAHVLYTQDGGKTWKRREFVTEFPLSGAWFVNNQRGWIVGGQDRILHTNDGGKTWGEQTNRFEGERDRMINDNKQVFSLAIVKDGSLEAMVQSFTQKNGGAKWDRQDSRIPLINGHVRDTINSIHFIDRRRGVAVADVGFITFTEDGGKIGDCLKAGQRTI